MKPSAELPTYDQEVLWHQYCVAFDPNEIARGTRETYISAGGFRAHVDIYAPGHPPAAKEAPKAVPTILFVHGTAVYARFYADFLYDLSRHGYRVVAPDLPGHGLSGGPRGHFTMDLLVTAVQDVLTWTLEQYPGRVALMGSSLGGITALYTVAKDARVAAAICHNAALLNEGAHKEITQLSGIFKVLAPLVPTLAWLAPKLRLSVWRYLDPQSLFADPALAPRVEILLDDALLSDRYTLRSLATQMRAPPARPPETIETPVMFLNGERDVLFSVDFMRALHARLTRSRATCLEVIPGGTHLILHEHRAECVARVTRWLENL